MDWTDGETIVSLEWLSLEFAANSKREIEVEKFSKLEMSR